MERIVIYSLVGALFCCTGYAIMSKPVALVETVCQGDGVFLNCLQISLPRSDEYHDV